jgi:hypothetical protein
VKSKDLLLEEALGASPKEAWLATQYCEGVLRAPVEGDTFLEKSARIGRRRGRETTELYEALAEEVRSPETPWDVDQLQSSLLRRMEELAFAYTGISKRTGLSVERVRDAFAGEDVAGRDALIEQDTGLDMFPSLFSVGVAPDAYATRFDADTVWFSLGERQRYTFGSDRYDSLGDVAFDVLRETGFPTRLQFEPVTPSTPSLEQYLSELSSLYDAAAEFGVQGVVHTPYTSLVDELAQPELCDDVYGERGLQEATKSLVRRGPIRGGSLDAGFENAVRDARSELRGAEAYRDVRGVSSDTYALRRQELEALEAHREDAKRLAFEVQHTFGLDDVTQ